MHGRAANGESDCRQGSGSQRPTPIRRAHLTNVRLDPFGAVFAATMIGGAIRFSTLNIQSFWDDEGFTVHLMRLGFVDMLEGVSETEGSPHLYYVLAWGWAQIFGTGEWGLRALSALFGTATIPVVYLAARAIGSRRGAAIAAFLVATSPLLAWYSQEARTYALFAFLSALTFLAFTQALGGDTRSLMWWAATASLALAAHYFAIFIVVPEAAWLLFSLGVRRATLGAAGIVAAVAAALLPVALHQSQHAGGALDTPLETRVAQVPLQLLVGYGVWAMPIGKLAAAASALLVGLAVWLLLRRSPAEVQRGAALAAGVASFAVAAPILSAYAGIDYLKTFYLIGSLPLFAIAVAQGFAATRAGSVAAAAVVTIGLSVIGLVAATPWLQRPDLRGVASALGPPTVARAIVLAPTSRIDVYMSGLRSFPARGRPISEVVFVSLPVKEAGEVPDVPRRLSSPFAVAGFKGSRHVFADRFTILRFRAPRPRGVSREALLRASFDEWPRELTSVVAQDATGH
jgi:mannosyltransferase